MAANHLKRLALLLILLAGAVSAVDRENTRTPPAPAPAVDCLSMLSSLSSCFAYVMPNSASPAPEKDCCSGVESLLGSGDAAVKCMCDAFNGKAGFAVQVNKTRAEALNGACHILNAPKCTGAPVPAPAPAASRGGPPVVRQPSSAAERPSSSASSLLVPSVEMILCITVFAAIFLLSRQ